MHKQRIWLAATASVGIHIGLLAWFTQAQATPKATLPSVIPIAVAFAAVPVAPAPAQPPAAKALNQTSAMKQTSANTEPKPRREPPKKPPVAKKQPPKPQTSRPAPAKPAQARRPSEAKMAPSAQPTPNNAAQLHTARPATPATAVPQEHYPARYRGAQPAPDYPRLARRRGMEGTCIIEVVMSPRGEVIRLALKQSTGHTLLDNAALDAVKQWKFVAPSGVDGPSKALVPVRFKLT